MQFLNTEMGDNDLKLIAYSEIYYNNKRLVPIHAAIKSLQGLQETLKYIPNLLHELTGIRIESFEIYATEIKASSWLTTLAFVMGFKNEEELLKARNKWAQDHPMLNRTLTTIAMVVIAGAATYAAFGGKGSITKGDEVAGDKINIQGNNNKIISIGALTLEVEPGDLKNALEKVVHNKHEFAANGSKIMAPAKLEKGVSIAVRSADLNLELTPEAIADVPEIYKKPPIDEREEHIYNARLRIRALDRDSHKSGWAGYLDGINRRLPITLSTAVNTNELHDIVYADVILLFKFDRRANKLLPASIHIKNLGDPHKAIGSLGQNQIPTTDTDIQISLFDNE